MKRSPVTDVKSSKSQAPTSREAPIRAYARYVFSVSPFRVPQGRSKISQRIIAGLWREHKTSPVRDERTHRSSPIFSVAPPAFAARLRLRFATTRSRRSRRRMRKSAASARRRPGLWMSFQDELRVLLRKHEI